jgi:2-oxoisovalerate dehydrogenase E1 component alpha subunit
MTAGELAAAPLRGVVRSHPGRDERMELLRVMALARAFRTWLGELRARGKMPPATPGSPSEGVEAGAAAALEPKDRLYAPAGRLAAHLARGVPVEHLAALCLGARERLGTGGGSIGAASRSADLADQALGAALAMNIETGGRVALAIAAPGWVEESDGALELAVARHLPLVVVIDQTAASGALATEAGTSHTLDRVSAADVEAILAVVGEAVTLARSGEGPVLVACERPRVDVELPPGARFGGSREEPSDPIAVLARRMASAGVAREQLQATVRSAQEVAEAAATTASAPARETVLLPC